MDSNELTRHLLTEDLKSWLVENGIGARLQIQRDQLRLSWVVAIKFEPLNESRMLTAITLEVEDVVRVNHEDPITELQREAVKLTAQAAILTI
jgi:hypothetical protein